MRLSEEWIVYFVPLVCYYELSSSRYSQEWYRLDSFYIVLSYLVEF